MSDLIVTRNGVPCEDQAAAIEEFKERCRRKEPDTITLTREELEGMKDNQVQHLGNFPMVATWNAAINAILEKMDERVEQP